MGNNDARTGGPPWCPIPLTPPGTNGHSAARVPLTTAFLSTDVPKPEEADTLRYALHLRLLSLRERDGVFGFFDHLEQDADFEDTLVIDVGTTNDGPALWSTWNSDIHGAIRDHHPTGDPLGDEDPETGMWVSHIALPPTAEPILGKKARIRLRVTPWI